MQLKCTRNSSEDEIPERDVFSFTTTSYMYYNFIWGHFSQSPLKKIFCQESKLLFIATYEFDFTFLATLTSEI